MRQYRFPIRITNNHSHVRVKLDSLKDEYTISFFRDGRIIRHISFNCVQEFPEGEQRDKLEAAFLALKPQLIEFFEGTVKFDIPSRTAASL